jgi:acetyl esterase
MALDSYTAAVLRRMSAAFPDLGGTVQDAVLAREHYRQAARFPAGPRMERVWEQLVPGRPDLRVRVYVPRNRPPGPAPVLVFTHGGGFVMCDLDSHDGVCRILAEGASCLVVSVDYRLAPEHPFPAACEDAYQVARWVHAVAAEWGGDPDRIAVAGDSAGGALAAATCLRARDTGHPRIAYQLLIYPVTDCLADRKEVSDSWLSATHMRWYIEQYLARPQDGQHPYASPLRAASLVGLPPGLILTAEHDPLQPEGEAYAERLAQEGNAVASHRVPGLFHGLFGLGALVPVARAAERLACAALRQGLRVPGRT